MLSYINRNTLFLGGVEGMPHILCTCLSNPEELCQILGALFRNNIGGEEVRN